MNRQTWLHEKYVQFQEGKSTPAVSPSFVLENLSDCCGKSDAAKDIPSQVSDRSSTSMIRSVSEETRSEDKFQQFSTVYAPQSVSIATPLQNFEHESTKKIQEETKKERNRRLAREFRARKKEETRVYRSTIVSLTQKMRTLSAENQRLRQLIRELTKMPENNTSKALTTEEKDKQIQKLEKQVALLQVLLHQTKQSELNSIQKQYQSDSIDHSSSAYLEAPTQGKLLLPPLNIISDNWKDNPLPFVPENESFHDRVSYSGHKPSLMDIRLSLSIPEDVHNTQAQNFGCQNGKSMEVDLKQKHCHLMTPTINAMQQSTESTKFYGDDVHAVSHSWYSPLSDTPLVYENNRSQHRVHI
eukprot:jgi/Galph1/2442/GphlegSOOS_G1129.1